MCKHLHHRAYIFQFFVEVFDRDGEEVNSWMKFKLSQVI